MRFVRNIGYNGWTVSLESNQDRVTHSKWHGASAWGIALLWYGPTERLSISLWMPTWSRNVKLWGMA